MSDDPKRANPEPVEDGAVRDDTVRDAAAAVRGDTVEVVEGRDGYTTRRRGGLGNAARVASKGSATTLFQPGVMVDSILENCEETTGSSTWVLQGEPKAPKLQPDIRPYFLVLGAPSGRERIPIVSSRTVFGRHEGDVRLDDSAISGRHFQLDVVGKECFVRDLESRNGTYLNGHPIRYAEVLPGDEVRAGETVLVFRLEGDDLERRD